MERIFDSLFVSRDEALILKRLGFNEPCLGYYLPETLGSTFNIAVCNEGSNPGWLSSDLAVACLCPTKKQAIDFLLKFLDFYYPNAYITLFSDHSGEVCYRTNEESRLDKISFFSFNDLFDSIV